MKKEYVEKMEQLKTIQGRTPEQEALLKALTELDTKEKVKPFNSVNIDIAREAAEEAMKN